MLNKYIFDKSLGEMIKIIKKFKETNELYAVRKDVGGNFMKIFKDSLFEYNDGIILLERFYKNKSLKYDMVNFPYMKDEDKELIKKLEDMSNSMPTTSEMEEEDVKRYSDEINKLCEDIKNIKPEYKEGSVKYIDSVFGKIIMKGLSEMSDDEILSRCILAISLALSMYESIFLVDEFDEGVSIMSIENDDYVDLVIVPYSNELTEEVESKSEDVLEDKPDDTLESELENEKAEI